MKKVAGFFTVVMGIFCFNTSMVYAQKFLLGFATGAMLFGGGDGDNIMGQNASIIYVMPRVSEIVKDPAGICFASKSYSFSCPRSERRSCAKGMSLAEIFAETVPDNKNYIILQVVRVFNPREPDYGHFWFAYVHKTALKQSAFEEH